MGQQFAGGGLAHAHHDQAVEVAHHLGGAVAQARFDVAEGLQGRGRGNSAWLGSSRTRFGRGRFGG